MSSVDREAARRAIRELVLHRCRELALPPGSRVAAYQPLSTEPGSVELLAALSSAGYRVILPHTLPDRDLDWLPWPRRAADFPPTADSPPASDSGPASGFPPASVSPPTSVFPPAAGLSSAADSSPAASFGLAAEAPPDALGVAAIGSAPLVLVPAFAVDRRGRRLGRGGGSYDRALTRVRAGAVVAALLFADELVEHVPTDPWDQPVTAAVSPDGWLDLTETGRRNT